MRQCSPEEGEVTEVSFDMFVRAVALLLEDNMVREQQQELEDPDHDAELSEMNLDKYFTKKLVP